MVRHSFVIINVIDVVNCVWWIVIFNHVIIGAFRLVYFGSLEISRIVNALRPSLLDLSLSAISIIISMTDDLTHRFDLFIILWCDYTLALLSNDIMIVAVNNVVVLLTFSSRLGP